LPFDSAFAGFFAEGFDGDFFELAVAAVRAN